MSGIFCRYFTLVPKIYYKINTSISTNSLSFKNVPLDSHLRGILLKIFFSTLSTMLGKWPSVFGPLLCNCISVMLRSHLHRQKIPLIQYLFEIPKLLGTWVVDFFFLSEPESGCRFYSTRITRSSFVNLWGSISDVVLRWMSCHNIILLYMTWYVFVFTYLGTCFIHFCISTLSTDGIHWSPSMIIKKW